MNQKKRWGRLIAGAVAVGLIGTGALAESTEVAVATPGNAVQFFWKGLTWDARTGVMPGTENKSRATMRLKNVVVDSQGNLEIKTMRHCVATENTLVTEATDEHVGQCESPRPFTKYSTGRIQTFIPVNKLPTGYDFTMKFHAKVPKGNLGTRTAFWVQNYSAATGACNDLYREIDVMESYGHRDVRSSDGTWEYDQTTYAGCSNGVKTPVETQIKDRVQPGTNHTYAVTRTANQISYSRDGVPTRTHTCPASTCAAGFNQQMQVLIQGEVFRKEYQDPDFVNVNKGDFPTMTTTVYDYTVAAQAPQPPGFTVATGSNIVNGHTEPFRRLNLNIANQPLMSWSCKLDNAAYSCPNPFAIDIGPLTNNGHTFSITATNAAGSGTYNTSWYGGQSKPVISIAAGTNLVNGNTDVWRRLNLSIGNQPLTTWSCTLDGAAYACPSPFGIDIGPLGYAGHSFVISATNYAGTTTFNPTWVSGQPAPTATQTSNIVNGSRLSVFHANYDIQNLPLTSWACTLDGAPYSCPNPFSVDIGPVAYGGHIFRIYFANYGGGGSSGADWVGGA